MFRRGASLPARPSIPNKDEILEDLSNASPDDVIYEYNEESSPIVDSKESKNSINEECDFDEDMTNISYVNIESLLNKISYLKNSMNTLQEHKANLKNLEENLLQDMSKVNKELNADKSS